MRIGLVRCLSLPEHDMDEAPLLAALREAGHQADTVAWDGDRPQDDPARYDACVLRATWNYYEQLESFGAWLEAADAATTLLNPLAAVRWNLHKGYLLELASKGVPIVPTALVEQGETCDVAALVDERGWAGGVVIKPAVSAGSWRTERFDVEALGAASAFLALHAEQRDMLVQPFVETVETVGERSICVIGGEPTHAVVKHARYAGGEESLGGAEDVGEALRAFASGVLGHIDHPLTYARVDVFDDGRDGLMLGELELIEPSLFLPLRPGAAERLVRAIESAT